MRRPSALLAALLLGSAAGVAVAVGPAAAAACPAGQGVTVVVGSSVSCDANGGGQAADNFRDAGHTLTMVDRQPGFVCRVDGVPASAGCVNTPPANAYWGLFWSDGTSGKWVYASQGAGSLSIPAGGWVGFAFQDGDARTPPGVTPSTAAPKPAPAPTVKAKPTPKAKATTKPTRQASKPATQPSPQPGTQSTPRPTTEPTPTQTPAASPTAATPSASAAPTDEPQAASTPEGTETDDTATAAAANTTDTDDSAGSGSLPLVAGALVVALIGGMGAVLWRRKAAGGSS